MNQASDGARLESELEVSLNALIAMTGTKELSKGIQFTKACATLPNILFLNKWKKKTKGELGLKCPQKQRQRKLTKSQHR